MNDLVENRELEIDTESVERRMRPFDAVCLSVGCAVGWGSFSLSGSTFLPLAGPFGTVIAMAIGALIVIVIAYGYHYMVNKMPVEGGAYVYAGRTFGRAHGFICAWSLILAYLMIVPINISALSVIARNLFGSFLEFGTYYAVFGYNVYLSEIVASALVLALVALLVYRDGLLIRVVFDSMSTFLVVGVLVLVCIGIYVAATRGVDVGRVLTSFNPNHSVLGGVAAVVAAVPFMFVGFDAIPQTMGKMAFSPRKVGPLLVIAIVFSALVYIALALIGAMAPPPGYTGWEDYIANVPRLSGLESLPTFYAAYSLFGDFGLVVFEIAAICAVLTGLAGFLFLSTRLVYTMARAGALSDWLAKPGKDGCAPTHALLFVSIAAFVMSLIGRTALTWIVDVSSLGAAIAFVYTSAATVKHARCDGRRVAVIFGALGVALSILFIVLLMFPIPVVGGMLDGESYVVLAAWIALGINFYDPSQSVS